MKFICIILICSLFITNIFSQFNEDFNDGDITAGNVWSGNTDHFIVENGVLRLSAPEAGSSQLYTNVTFPDSFVMTMYVNMNFDPSGSNYLRLNLASANNSETYYQVRLGENGSEDDIEFWRISDVEEEFLASGITGNISKSPKLNLKITRRLDGLWEIFADYSLNGAFELEATFFDNMISLADLNTFEIECTYTASRVDEFYFDNISIIEYTPDVTAPSLLQVAADSKTNVILTFDEPIDASSLDNLNYSFQPSLDIGFVSFTSSLRNEISISLNTELSSDVEYLIQASGITDVFGNVNNLIEKNFRFYSSPSIGQLLLSEILFDPYSDGEDFIELYNASNSYLNLKGLLIKNAENDQEKEIASDLYLEPNEYVALSSYIDFLRNEYLPISTAILFQNDLPAFDNANGIPFIQIREDDILLTLDSMSYDESQHFQLLDDTEGVSLERLSFNQSAADLSNWYSSASTNNYATPGYKNSNFVNIDKEAKEAFSITDKVFSPYNSENRLLKIQYKLDKPGSVVNVIIFNSRGHKVRELSNNQLLGSEGVILWDGLNEENSIVPIGPYLIIIEGYSDEGNVFEYKEYCVVADYLN